MSRFLIVLMMGLGLYGQALPDLTVASISTTNVTTDTQSLLVSGTLGVTVRNLGAPVATVFRVVAWEDRDGNGVLNPATDVTLGSAASNGTIATGGDQVVVIPVAGRVLFRGNRIWVKVDSGETVGESDETNNVSDTARSRVSVATFGNLTPTVKWIKRIFSVRPDSDQVMMAPVVIDINSDGTPDVVFSTFTGGNYLTGGVLRAISGKDGTEIWTLTDPKYLVRGEASLAAGDIDGDGRPEIIAVHESMALMAVEHDGTFKWLSEVQAGGRYYPGSQWGGASLVDLNHDGSPEIVFGATVLRSNGTTLWKGTVGKGDGGVGPLSVPVDLDLDGNLEIVAGHTAYRADGSIMWTAPGIADGFVAIGNFDSDPRPEVVLVSDGQVYLVSSAGKVIWGPVAVPGGGGGPPTVADMDGDGVPEIGVAGSSQYVAFRKDGSILWQAATRDNSSFQTGSSVFDFEGDGKAEVVYGDELNLRIYRGSDGTVLYTLPKSSCTTYELPVIADVDGDKRADILAVANQACGYGPQSGVYLISGDNWVNTRSIWNQHSYHVTNVNDDGTIPRFEQPNWIVPGLNNFRLNTFSQPGLASGSPDFTSSLIRKEDAAFPSSVVLTARVGNGGAVASAPGIPCPAVAPTGLTVTAGAKARGFCLSVFASGFPNTFSIGPLGVAFPASGGVLVSDYPGNVRRFPTNADGQQVTSVAAVTYGQARAVDMTKADGVIYMADQAGSRLLRLNDDGTLNSVVNPSLPGATGLAAHPFNGHVFVSSTTSAALWDVDPKTGVARVFKATSADGISISQDGSVLYAAWNNRVLGFRMSDGTEVFDSGTISSVDGTALGVGSLAGFLYANTNDGRVVEVNLNTREQSVIASGGSRGDFVTVDPNGSLLVTMTDRIYRLIPPAGGSFGAQNIPVTFYRGDPASGGTRIATTRTTKALEPGDFEDVSVIWTGATAGLHPIVVVADDNGSGVGFVSESDESNNKAGANVLLGVGPFPLVDGLLTRFKDRAVDLEWAAVPGAASYTLYRRSGSGSLSVVQRGLLTTRFSDANLTNGTAYSYVVRWVNGAGLESADGTEASAIPTPDVRTDGTPPTILSNPLTRARALARYSYQVAAGDPDPGEVLTYSLTSAPAGMTISGTGLIEWTPSLQQFGYFNVTVRVQDRTLKAAVQTFRLFTEVEIINNPPVITSAPISAGASGETYSYRVLARDPDAGDLLTYSLVAAPTGMSINPATGLISWLPTRQQVASHPVTVRVTDLGGLRAEQSFAIAVARGNTAPRFTSLPVTFTRAGAGYRYQPTAMDAEGDPLTYKLDSVAPAAAITVDGAAGTVGWTVPSGAAGTVFDVTIRVTDDGGLSATQAYRITVGAANQPPVISSTAVTTAVANVSYRYAVTATDPNLPDEVLTYSLVLAPVGMTIAPLTGVVDWVPGATLGGTNVNVAVRVTDQGGLTATQTFVVTVRPPDLTRPAVSLLAPANGSTLTNDAPVTGTVTDDNLRLWRVEYRTVDAADWRVLSTGTTNVPTAGSLGTFPATLLANDVYRMRLYAEDAGGSVTSPEIEVTIDTKQLKMGDFTLSYEDLRVPGFTFPISIVRKYDSKRPQVGDFGPGWTLSFSEVDVRLDVNKNPTLTLPDGRRVKFTYEPVCAGFSPLLGCIFPVYNSTYVAPPGVYDKLENLDCPQTIGRGAGALCGFDAYVARVWRLTTREGIKYEITDGAVTRMEDRNGNFLKISRTGVESNFGRDVVFERDGAGRISRIVEPGNGGTLRYEYDAQGRLVRFLNQGNQPTNFAYGAVSYPYYITGITDALGRAVLRNVFDAGGRLVAQCAPNGNINTLVGCSQFSPQPAGRLFKAINGRGLVTELSLDDSGNILRERRYVDAARYVDVIRTYDSSGRLLSESGIGNDTTRFTYDAEGKRTSETDPVGRVTRYSYNSCQKLESMRDPLGSLTSMIYDDQCRLRFIVDARGGSTEFRYNKNGQRTHSIDPIGNMRIWDYDSRGSLQRITDPFGKSTLFSFNSVGKLLSRTDRNGRRIDFVYDAGYRLMQERWGDGRTISYTVDLDGAMLSAIDSQSQISITYDDLARVKTFRTSGGAGTPQISFTYSYDAIGNVTEVSDSLGGGTTYVYDGLNRLTSLAQSGQGVKEKRADLEYDQSGVLTALRRYSNLSGSARVLDTQFEYDCAGCPGRLAAIRHRRPDNSVVQDLIYSRDDLGNITSIRDGDGQHMYTYDALRRLESAIHTPSTLLERESYSYDAASNRATSHLSSDHAYSYETTGVGNRLLEDAQFRYAFDDEGNVIRKTDRVTGAYVEFSYDFRNRTSRVTRKTPAGITLSDYRIIYDALNRRIGTSLDGVSTWYGLDGQKVTLEINSSGAVVSRQMLLTLGRALAEERNGQTNWVLLDHLGTPRDFVNDSGVVLNHQVFDSYGQLVSKSNQAFVTNLSFAGHHAGAFGDIYMYARNYDPRSGRFSQEDPLKPFGYSYAASNPIGFYDPTGGFVLGEYLGVTGMSVVSNTSAFVTGTGIPGTLDPFEVFNAWAPSFPGFIGFLGGFSASTFQFLGEFLAADQLSLPDRWRTAVEKSKTGVCADNILPVTDRLIPSLDEFTVFGGYCGGHKFGIERLERMQPR